MNTWKMQPQPSLNIIRLRKTSINKQTFMIERQCLAVSRAAEQESKPGARAGHFAWSSD